MRDMFLVLRKEWKAFTKSESGIFFIYGILIFAWSFLISSEFNSISTGDGYLWLVFFSVIISGNFSNSVFVSERMSGSLEILLTSGISRRSILYGKSAFVMIMSVCMGFLCYCIAFLINIYLRESYVIFNPTLPVCIYISACFMNTSCGAWLSVRLTNPRLVHFANLFMLAFVIVLHRVLSLYVALSDWSLTAVLFAMGFLLMILAYRNYKSERIIQPVVY